MPTYIASILPQCGGGGGGGGQRVHAVERWWRRPAQVASIARDRGESSGDLESFAMKSKMPRGGLLFIGLKLSAAVLNYN
jgi:hypothetical protein